MATVKQEDRQLVVECYYGMEEEFCPEQARGWVRRGEHGAWGSPRDNRLAEAVAALRERAELAEANERTARRGDTGMITLNHRESLLALACVELQISKHLREMRECERLGHGARAIFLRDECLPPLHALAAKLLEPQEN